MNVKLTAMIVTQMPHVQTLMAATLAGVTTALQGTEKTVQVVKLCTSNTTAHSQKVKMSNT